MLDHQLCPCSRSADQHIGSSRSTGRCPWPSSRHCMAFQVGPDHSQHLRNRIQQVSLRNCSCCSKHHPWCSHCCRCMVCRSMLDHQLCPCSRSTDQHIGSSRSTGRCPWPSSRHCMAFQVGQVHSQHLRNRIQQVSQRNCSCCSIHRWPCSRPHHRMVFLARPRHSVRPNNLEEQECQHNCSYCPTYR